jgi:hypothetical protein
MLSIEALRRGVLWTFLAVSAFAAIEPSPYEFMFGVALLAFASRGLRFDKATAPLILTLAVWNVGGLLALVPFVDERESVMFIVITVYISLTAIFFSAVVADAPERMTTIRSGYMFAAVIAAVLGIIGYFNVGGLGHYFTLYENSRASGPFKDPNVFGPFLVPPVVWLCQDLLLRRGRFLPTISKLLVLMLAVLLSFSRGAIIACISSLILLLALTFLTAGSSSQRRRTVTVTVLCALMMVVVVAIIFAIPSVREMALSRASLAQDYDVGEEGRFGNQLRAIPLLLELPFGFGPLRFIHVFPQDPHDAFLSAFASFGWLGGLGFITFIGVTIYLGWVLAFQRSRLQPEVVALWSSLLPQILQGVQIDTLHWRHLFLMCGCLYGLAAAERIERARGRVWRAEPKLGPPSSRVPPETGAVAQSP